MANVIESIEYYDYRPPVSENINELGTEFPITVYNEDLVTLPSKSLIVITGKVELKTKDGVIVSPIDTKQLNFVNNGILLLFDRIDYYLGDAKIDSIRKPGISTTIKGLVSFESDLKYNNAGWRVNNENRSVLNSSGYFSVSIPLSLVMGFFEDCKQFLYRIPQKMVFYVSTVNFNLAIESKYSSDHTITVVLKDVLWRMPQVKLSMSYEANVRKEILNNTDYELNYRTWLYHSISNITGTDYTWDMPVNYSRPKYILIAFSKDSKPSFDLKNLENLQVLLNNNVYYPRERLNVKVAENKASNLYQMFKAFKSSYYSKDEECVDPIVDYTTFLETYPIVVVDCSYQPSVIKDSLINIKVIMSWRDPFVPSNVIHCVLIMDDKAVYNPLNNRVTH